MAATTYRSFYGGTPPLAVLRARLKGRGLWFGLILLAALVAFELFNFSTTEYALNTLFGSHEALGLATWAQVLAIAFCGIDFAGLSRLFTPETGRKEPKEIWLLTGAWFLGAGMNAIMTWWAVGSALAENSALGNELVSRADILHYGPIFIAGLVWLTRILIIGTFAFAGDHIFTTAEKTAGGVVDSVARPVRSRSRRTEMRTSTGSRAVPKPQPAASLPVREYGLPSLAADDPGTQRRHETQRSLFGRGAGRESRPAATPPAAFSRRTAERERPTRPTATSAAFSGSRASTTRSIRRDPPRESSRSAVPSPEPTSTELEYVDLD